MRNLFVVIMMALFGFVGYEHFFKSVDPDAAGGGNDPVPEPELAEAEPPEPVIQAPPPVAPVRPSGKKAFTELEILQMDERVENRFNLNRANPYKVITLKNGKTLVAESVRKSDTAYSASVAFDDKRTIFNAKLLPLSEVTKVEDEDPLEAVYAGIKKTSLPSTAKDTLYHDRVAALVFDPFVKNSKKADRVKEVNAIREVWLAEAEKIKQGHRKLEGTWYAPDEPLPRLLPKQTRQLLGMIQKAMSNGQYLQAATYAKQVRIPSDFGKEQAAFRRLVDKLSLGLEGYMNRRAQSYDARKRTAKSQYDSAIRQAHRAGSFSAKRPGESSGFRSKGRLAEKRKELAAQGAGRKRDLEREAKTRYEQEMQKIQNEIQRMKDEVLDLQDDLRKI